MKIKSLQKLTQIAEQTRIGPDKMPNGRYGFTVQSVVLSNTENDCALYVNCRVHGDKASTDCKVRVMPGIDSAGNWASAYTVANLLDVASPGTGDDFKDMLSDTIEALDEGDEDGLGEAIEKMQTATSSVIAGLNFTGEFVWNKSESTGKFYINLRTSSTDKDGNRKVTVELDHVREPVIDGIEDATNLPARTLVKGKQAVKVKAQVKA
jgi:hypothetical protein